MFDNCMSVTEMAYSMYHSGSNAGFDPQCFSQLGDHMAATAPCWLQPNDSSDLTLDIGFANAADLSSMPVETPTLDRHVPAMHVSCRAAETSAFVEQSSEQPVVRSWIVSEEMTLTGEPCTDFCSAPMVSELSTQELCSDFCTAPMAPSMKILDVSDLCGVPLETPTLDRYAPTVAIRGDFADPREGLKLSLADYLL